MKKKSFNCTRLSEVVAGAQSTDKIDLVVELDFLGKFFIYKEKVKLVLKILKYLLRNAEY